ncbi:hypothetical protein DCS_06946 [Drechmeria coniospora]|uniref:Uncharacterized protein n=1 Tax=Drechmeria coniospora TaxID=98403 RepID=A0A151GD35_DRECN|nr:hypothetical protein DCS_06946 [Drechmeria coniospora]KYK54985.1 hypothetical protein DCS_06946 [Drechmeria coniospora]
MTEICSMFAFACALAMPTLNSDEATGAASKMEVRVIAWSSTPIQAVARLFIPEMPADGGPGGLRIDVGAAALKSIYMPVFVGNLNIALPMDLFPNGVKWT